MGARRTASASFLAALLATLGGHAAPAGAADAPAPAPAPAPAAADDDGPSLTVYSSADPAGFDPTRFVAQQRQGATATAASQVPGFGVVRDTRRVDVPAAGELAFADVAEHIDPTTVAFDDLTDPAGTAVLEQAFRFDLASPDKLLDRYVGRRVGYVVRAQDGTLAEQTEGTVVSINQGTVVLQTGAGLRFVPARDPGLRLPRLPEGIVTRPTLVWKVASASPGSHRVRTTYQTAGLTWRADYNLVLDASGKKAELGAWVTLLNVSGASWRDARLRLVAGDVARVRTTPTRATSSGGSTRGGFDAGPGFEEKAFFEYHLYTLPRRTDVLENSTQQLVLFPTARDVGVERVLVYYGLPEAASWSVTPQPRTDRDVRAAANPKVDVYLRVQNTAANHLGMPLPRGRVRVLQQDDAAGTPEFVGEDVVDHTPEDETVLVKVGQAFDVVGERTQTAFEVDASRRTMSESVRVVLRNRKAEAVRVTVRETLFRWMGWEVTQSSRPFVKRDARTVHFDVDLAPGATEEVTYTVRYAW